MSNHLEEAPAWLNAKYLEPLLKKSLSRPNLKIKHIDIKSGSNVGDNYVCRIFRIDVKTDEDDVSVIAKYKPENAKVLGSLKDDEWDPCAIECMFFKDVLPTLRYCMEKEDDFAPICYGIDMEKNIILMEDLVKKGFSLQRKGVFLNRDQCVLTIEALAAMHGASYYAVKDDPSLKNTFGKTLWDRDECEILDKCFANAHTQIEKNVSTYGISSNQSKKLLGFLEKYKQNRTKMCSLREGRLNFLLHGDCWMNNMMFHYENGTADAVKLVDYQVLNYNCFANDLQYFFFSSVESNVVLNDLDFLLEKYFTKLQNVASDIPNLTLDRVKAEFAERYYMGYLMAIGMRPFVGATDIVSFDDVLDGKSVEMGFNSPGYISDIQKFLPFFESVGIL